MRSLIVSTASLLATFLCQEVSGCTGIVRTAQNGDVVYARTLEFGEDLLSFDLLATPKGYHYQSQPHAKNGKTLGWDTKYSSIGFAPFGLPLLADGLNSAGVGCGAFYMPGWADYQAVSDEDERNAISNLDFVSWVLGNFDSVATVRTALKDTKVFGAPLAEWGFVPPLHYIVVDKSGDKAVIEYINGTMQIHDAPLNTITNAPSYDWHNINARNYIGLKALNDPSIKINGSEFAQFGQGSGAIGLPGDFTPPSRFIRAAFLNQVVVPTKNGDEEAKSAFTILNQFDIPLGAVRELHNGKEILEETSWTSASDLQNQKYFFHTHGNRSIRAFDLKNWIPQNSKPVTLPAAVPEVIQMV